MLSSSTKATKDFFYAQRHCSSHLTSLIQQNERTSWMRKEMSLRIIKNKSPAALHSTCQDYHLFKKNPPILWQMHLYRIVPRKFWYAMSCQRSAQISLIIRLNTFIQRKSIQLKMIGGSSMLLTLIFLIHIYFHLSFERGWREIPVTKPIATQ